MAVSLDLNFMMQANRSYHTARMVNNTQRHMENEKQQISTEIKLDGHSSGAKDQRLNQIDSQSAKADSMVADAVNTSNEQTRKASEQKKDSSAVQEPEDKADGNTGSVAVSVSTQTAAKAVNAGIAVPMQPHMDVTV